MVWQHTSTSVDPKADATHASGIIDRNVAAPPHGNATLPALEFIGQSLSCPMYALFLSTSFLFPDGSWSCNNFFMAPHMVHPCGHSFCPLWVHHWWAKLVHLHPFSTFPAVLTSADNWAARASAPPVMSLPRIILSFSKPFPWTTPWSATSLVWNRTSISLGRTVPFSPQKGGASWCEYMDIFSFFSIIYSLYYFSDIFSTPII